MPPIGDALRALRTTSFAGAVWGLRWQAPEVTLALTSQQPKDANAPAELVRFRGARLVAQCRLGQGLTAIAGLVSTLAAADTVGVADVREAMLLELAALAAPVGLPGAAVTAASLVLDSDEATPLARGAALLRLARSLTDPRHRAAVHDALGAAELVYSRCAAGQADTVGLAAAELRAVVPLHTARVARRDGEGERALAEVRRGIALLADTERDSGLLRARLCLEEVSVLLDLGDQRQACERAEILLEQPIRALAAGPASWLALTLAARVHGPAGRPARTEICLRTAERLARRHRLDLPLGQALTGLAQLCEQSQRPSDALRYLREAQSLGLRRAGQQTDARTALVGRFGSQVEHAPRVNADRLACWLASAAPTTRETAALPRATHSSTAEPIDVPASLRFDSDVPAGLSVQSPATSTDPSAARVGPVATQQSTASSAARVALPTSAGPALAELTETTDRLRAPRPESETSAMGVDVDPMPWSDFAPARGADATAPRPARGRRRAPEISDTSPQRPAETSASARSSSAARHGGLDHGRTGSGRVAGPSLDTGYPSDLWTSSGSAAAAGRACIGDPMADLAPEPEMHDGSLVGWAGQLADPTPIRMARSARSGVTVDTGGAGDEGDEVVDSGHLGTAEFTS
ncbi:MAG: hypothetical protein ACRDRL_30490, partial [Sciscionella sp.]